MRGTPGKGCRWEATMRARIRFLGFFITLLLVVPAAKAFYLQIHQRDILKDRASRQSQVIEKVSSHRGAILDRNGQPLAISVPLGHLRLLGTTLPSFKSQLDTNGGGSVTGPITAARKITLSELRTKFTASCSVANTVGWYPSSASHAGATVIFPTSYSTAALPVTCAGRNLVSEVAFVRITLKYDAICCLL